MEGPTSAPLPPPSPAAAPPERARLPSLKISGSFRHDALKTLERYFSSRDRFETPDHEKAALYRVFQKFDGDGDGKLSVDEISASLAKLGIVISLEDLRSLLAPPSPFPQIQAQEDPTLMAECSLLDFDDFRQLYRALCQEDDDNCSSPQKGLCPSPSAKVQESDLRSAFDLFDKNGDGYITVVELQAVLLSLGFKEARSLDVCKSMIAIVDADGDGRVNFAEFRIMMKEEKFA